MAILNYTTSIASEKSIGEIQKCLVKNGANKIVTDYINGIPVSVTFCLDLNGNSVAFSLPANNEGVLLSMQNDRKIPKSKCTEAQAQRVAWRIVKDWVEAQMAIVESQLAEMSEVFLPYIITKNGNTLFTEIKRNPSKTLLLR